MPTKKLTYADGKSEGEERLAMHLKAKNIPFVRQYVFIPGRRWAADFLIGDGARMTRYLVEVDGGNHMVRKAKDGRHLAVGAHVQDNDNERRNAAALAGWRMLHFSPAQVRSGYAIDTIALAISECGRGGSYHNPDVNKESSRG